MRLFAAGDIHGERTKLESALKQAELVDTDLNWTAENTTLVCTGDYIDRGPDSKGVVDLLIKLKAQAEAMGSKVVTLKGNHEQMMLDSLGTPDGGGMWLMNGGRACAASYGLGMKVYGGFNPDVTHSILTVHGDFYMNLEHYHIQDDTLFVHAGLVAGKTVDQLGSDGDISHLWIRSPFYIYSDPKEYLRKNYGVERVIFGHTIHEGKVTPYFEGQYLCIDTGSFLPDGCVSIIEVLPELSWRVAGQGK